MSIEGAKAISATIIGSRKPASTYRLSAKADEKKVCIGIGPKENPYRSTSTCDINRDLCPPSPRVIDHGEENRMTTQSVAIVFGPTLLRPETETLNMAVHMVYQNQIVELILLEYEAIFGK